MIYLKNKKKDADELQALCIRQYLEARYKCFSDKKISELQEFKYNEQSFLSHYAFPQLIIGATAELLFFSLSPILLALSLFSFENIYRWLLGFAVIVGVCGYLHFVCKHDIAAKQLDCFHYIVAKDNTQNALVILGIEDRRDYAGSVYIVKDAIITKSKTKIIVTPIDYQTNWCGHNNAEIVLPRAYAGLDEYLEKFLQKE